MATFVKNSLRVLRVLCVVSLPYQHETISSEEPLPRTPLSDRLCPFIPFPTPNNALPIKDICEERP